MYKIQILLEFSLTWIRLTCLWPSIFLEIARIQPFITPLKIYIRNPLDTLKAWDNWEQRNYSPLLLELVLESASLCPLEHFGVLPKLSFCLWACYQEMEDWGGGGPSRGSVSPICRCADRGCIHCNLWFYINRNIFSCPIMYVWMNILSLDDFQCLYIVDYIF